MEKNEMAEKIRRMASEFMVTEEQTEFSVQAMDKVFKRCKEILDYLYLKKSEFTCFEDEAYDCCGLIVAFKAVMMQLGILKAFPQLDEDLMRIITIILKGAWNKKQEKKND